MNKKKKTGLAAAYASISENKTFKKYKKMAISDYKKFSDFVYKNKNIIIIALFAVLFLFFSLQFYYVQIWDFLVRIMNAQFFFHGGTYFEVPRELLESVVIGLFGFLLGNGAVYGFIFVATALFFLASYDFSKSFNVPFILVLLILMNPYIIFYSMEGGSELIVFSFLILFISEIKSKRAATSAVFFALAFVSKYSAIFFIPLAFFLIDGKTWQSLKRILLFIGVLAVAMTPFLAYNLILFHNFLYSFGANVQENGGGGPIPNFTTSMFQFLIEFVFLIPVVAIMFLLKRDRFNIMGVGRRAFLILLVSLLIGIYVFTITAPYLLGGYRFLIGATIFATLLFGLFVKKIDAGFLMIMAVIGILIAVSILYVFAANASTTPAEIKSAIALFASAYNTTNCTVQSNEWVELNYYGLSATYQLYNTTASEEYPILNFGPVNTTYPLIKTEGDVYLYGYSSCKYTPPVELPGYFYYDINQSRADPNLGCYYTFGNNFMLGVQVCEDINNVLLKLVG